MLAIETVLSTRAPIAFANWTAKCPKPQQLQGVWLRRFDVVHLKHVRAAEAVNPHFPSFHRRMVSE
jgi:hypothetical protein